MKVQLLISLMLTIFSFQSRATDPSGKYFDRAIIVIFENTDYSKALKQPFFNQLAHDGALFTNFLALAHPSQGNYIALTAGDLHGVKNDAIIDLDVPNIADLLEANGLTWKVYAEGYPGNCFAGGSNKLYARKHNPFISFTNIRTKPSRCANIVNANQFAQDAANGKLPSYVFYVPDLKNDGHDTGVSYADKWYSAIFSKYIYDPQFMERTVVISTFDESSGGKKNQIYTTIVGPSVKTGDYSEEFNIYSLLKIFEDNWNLGSITDSDANAKLPDVWQ